MVHVRTYVHDSAVNPIHTVAHDQLVRQRVEVHRLVHGTLAGESVVFVEQHAHLCRVRRLVVVLVLDRTRPLSCRARLDPPSPSGGGLATRFPLGVGRTKLSPRRYFMSPPPS